jgi:hypothetical protein
MVTGSKATDARFELLLHDAVVLLSRKCLAKVLTHINDSFAKRPKDTCVNVRPNALWKVNRGTPTASKMAHSPAQSPIKRCPVCGISMLGSRTKPSHPQLDQFECLNCGVVMNYSELKTRSRHKPTNEEET